jgi:hypothetical protein
LEPNPEENQMDIANLILTRPKSLKFCNLQVNFC